MVRIIGVAVLFGGCHLAVAAPDIKEGLWEITSKMNMPNMPIQMPASKVMQCITRQE